MSENAFTRMQAIAAVLIKKSAISDNSKFIILDTDTCTASTVQNLTEGQFTISGEWSFSPETDFYTAASEIFYGSGDKNADIFEICAGAATQLKRFLQDDLSEERNALLNEEADITCKKLTELYKSAYEEPLKKALGEAIKAEPSVNVYPIGRLAAFYPALHSVKEMLCEMPFLPAVPFFVGDKEYFCDTAVFEAMGKEFLTEAEKKKRSVKGNILLILKKLTPNGLEDEYRLLSPAGASFTDFAVPNYTEPFFAHKDDTLTLLADVNNYSVRLPDNAFRKGTDCELVSLGLIYDGEKLMLSIKNNSGTVSAELDQNIYS